MAIPIDKALYEKAKEKVYKQYEKPSAYRSAALVKLYKSMGGRYKDNNKKERPLKDWFNEKWEDINPNKTKDSYPVYRPTKRVNKNTPLLLSQIDKKNLEKQIKLKQRIKGTRNLPKFEKKGL
jgi:hypothetical protein